MEDVSLQESACGVPAPSNPSVLKIIKNIGQKHITAGNWAPQAHSDYNKLPLRCISSQNLTYLLQQTE